MKIFAFALVLAASTAMAGHHEFGFDDLRQACKDPAKYQNQIKPSSIQISFADKVVRWIPAGNSKLTLPAFRLVNHKVTSDKYTVPSTKVEVPFPPTQDVCPVWKQIEEVTSISKEITCETIEGFTGTATDMCITILDDLKAENPAATIPKETGKVATFCKPELVGGPSNPPPTPLKKTK